MREKTAGQFALRIAALRSLNIEVKNFRHQFSNPGSI